MTRVKRQAKSPVRGFRLIPVLPILAIAAAGCQPADPSLPAAAPGASGTSAPPVSGQQQARPLPTSEPTSPAGSAEALSFSWLPPDAQLVLQVRVQDLLNAPLLRPIVQELGLLARPTPLGVNIGQIHSITASSPSLHRTAGGAIDPGMLIVLKTTAPVDATSFQTREDVQPVAAAERPMFRRRGDAPGRGPEFIALAEPTTLLMGAEKDVRAALARGREGKTPARFRFVEQGPQLVALSSFDPRAEATAFALGDAPPEVRELFASASRHAQAVALTIRVDDGAEIALLLNLVDQTSAATIVNDLHALGELARRWLKENEQAAALYLPILQPLAHQLTASATGRVAALRTRLSAEGARQLGGMGRLMASMALGDASGQGLFGGPAERLRDSAVSATAAEGLPQGMALRIAGQWTDSPAGPSESLETPEKLKLVLLVDPGPTADVVAYGEVHVEEARLDDGGRLKRATDLLSGATARNVLNVVGRDPFLNRSGRELSIAIPFHHPTGSARSIEELSGRILLRTARQRLGKRIDNLCDWVGRSGEELGLKPEEFEVMRSGEQISGNGESLLVLVAPSIVVSELSVGDAGSELQAGAFVEGRMLPDGRSLYTISFSEGKIPDVVPVRFQLATDWEDRQVSFRFEDVPLPESQPLSPQQQALVSWQPTLLPDEVPGGMSLEARARWSLTVGFDADGKQTPRPLEIAVDAVGEKALQSVAYGKLTVSEASTSAGPLDLATAGNPFLLEAQHKLVAVEREFMLDEYPPDGVQAVFSFDAPEESAQRVTAFAGSFTLVTAARQQTLRIADLLSRTSGPFSTPELAAHGIELQLQRYGENLTVSVVSGRAEQIADIKLVDQRSLPLPGVFGGRSSFGGSVEFSFSSTAPIPEHASLEITVNEGLQHHEVPFRFENLTIPAPPPAQQRLEF